VLRYAPFVDRGLVATDALGTAWLLWRELLQRGAEDIEAGEVHSRLPADRFFHRCGAGLG